VKYKAARLAFRTTSIKATRSAMRGREAAISTSLEACIACVRSTSRQSASQARAIVGKINVIRNLRVIQRVFLAGIVGAVRDDRRSGGI
jgi:hypothetical protein